MYKLVWCMIIQLLFIGPILASEKCNELSCVTDKFMKENRISYYKILSDSIEQARNCSDTQRTYELLEFSIKVRGHVRSEEILSEYIENEFMKNPACILKQVDDLSEGAKYQVTHFLAFPTYIHGDKIRSVLLEHKNDYPREVDLILSGSEK